MLCENCPHYQPLDTNPTFGRCYANPPIPVGTKSGKNGKPYTAWEVPFVSANQPACRIPNPNHQNHTNYNQQENPNANLF